MTYLSPEYKAYINSTAWQKKRLEKFLQVGERCQNCKKPRSKVPRRILQVHHLTYERLGHERLDDLQVLCLSCHQKATARMRRQRAQWWQHKPVPWWKRLF